MLIQAGFALVVPGRRARAARTSSSNDVFDHDDALYDVLVVGTLAYAASYFARGWLAGHEYFAPVRRAGADGVGLAPVLRARGRARDRQRTDGRRAGHRRRAVGLAGRRAGGVRAHAARSARALRRAPGGARTRPTRRWRRRSPPTRPTPRSRAPAPRACRRRPRTTTSRCAAARGFAGWVSGIMLSEQTLLNAAVLTVARPPPTSALAGIVFNVLLIARAPLQLFQAIQTSLLPHLTGLETTAGHEAFARAIRVTVLAIAAFAAAVALGLLAIGPFVMRHLFGQHYSYGRFGLALDRRRHGPAPDLRRAQPGRAGARPRARRGRAAGCSPRWCSSRWMLTPAVAEPAAAHRDRLRRRDRAAGAAAVRRSTGRARGVAGGRASARSGRADGARDRPVGLARVGRVEDRRAGDEHAGAGRAARGRRVGVDARRPPRPPRRRRRARARAAACPASAR